VSVELAHTLNGPPGAPVVVLSNSLGTSMEMWAAQVPALSTRLQVLRYDQRGHGGSPAPAGPYDFATLGRDLIDLLDHYGIDRASICGVSMGGMTAMWVAAHEAERVDRIALCFTSAYLPPAEMWEERAATARAYGMESLIEPAIGRWFTPEFAASGSPQVLARTRANLAAVKPEGYASCCEAIAGMDLREDIGDIRAPTLVVSASEDPATPPDHGRLIADTIPGARFELVEGARHLACLERPEDVTPLILDFLDPEQEAS
jgi:3-oxoadipate enol-lactonase